MQFCILLPIVLFFVTGGNTHVYFQHSIKMIRFKVS